MFDCLCCINSNIINKSGSLTKEDIIQLINEFSITGVKGIIYIGGGEPLMHSNFGEIIQYASSKKIKNGITTNGYLIDKYLNDIANYSSWTRVSVDACNNRTFDLVRPSSIHNAFNKVISNMESLSKIKKGSLGFSFLLLENSPITNVKEIYNAAKLAKNIGCDYFEIKPMVDMNHYLFSYSSEFLKELYEQINKAKLLECNTFNIEIANSLNQYKSASLTQDKQYNICPSVFLRNVVTPHGVYPCPYKRGIKKYNLGTIEDGYINLLKSNHRKQVLEMLNPKNDCKFYCIRNEINEYLTKLNINDLSILNPTKTDDVFV